MHVLKRAIPLSNGPWSSCFARTDAETCLLIGASSKTVNLSTTIPFRRISYSNRSCDKSNAHHRIFQKRDLLVIRINKYQQKITFFFAYLFIWYDVATGIFSNDSSSRFSWYSCHMNIQICYSIIKFLSVVSVTDLLFDHSITVSPKQYDKF